MDPTAVAEFWLRLDQQVWQLAVWLLPSLAVYLLISGLDDLAVDLLRLRERRPPEFPKAKSVSDRARIAIMIPMWREAEVAAPMLRHNLAALRDGNFSIFVGLYPNDPETVRAVEECAGEDNRIRVCFVDHPGPTSKADCLNAIWLEIQRQEERSGLRFELLVLHDAEDVIHPASLTAYRSLAPDWGMIQFPVLPLPTPASAWTHGVYCDDFAESQGFDLRTRIRLGAFLPGCGVGTAFRRDTLELLACDGPPFDGDLLTEDYETGLRLYRLGITQIFVPLRFEQGQPVATREFFPQTLGGAVRQRGRWVAGNSLQSWSRHGWSSREGTGLRARLAQCWFLWRDRKGLWGNPVSLLCNALFVFGLQSSLGSLALEALQSGTAAHAAPELTAPLRYLLAVNFALLATRIGFRMHASARVYGWRFAAGVLPRMFWGNLVNAAATARAIHLWFAHVWGGRSLAWNKTTHHYPAPAGLFGYKRPLEEILLEERFVAPGDCEFARRQCAEGEDIAQSLLRLRLLTEDQMYEAISLQQGIPLARWQPAFEPGRIAFAIPEALQQRFQAISYRVESGRLYVAAVHPPSEEMEREIRRWTRLEVRFHLVSPGRFHALREGLWEHASYNPEDGTTPSRAIRRRAAGAGAD